MWDKCLSTRAKYIQKLMQRGKNGNSNEGSNVTCIMLEQVENADFELSKYTEYSTCRGRTCVYKA
jgi:hypothetical protein